MAVLMAATTPPTEKRNAEGPAERTSARPLNREILRSRYALTARELHVAELVSEALTAVEIANRLGISVHTARRHMEQLYRKLGVHSRGEAQRLLRP